MSQSQHWAKINRKRWGRVRLAVLTRDNYRCTNSKCGKAGRLEVHHRKALENGGAPYRMSNLATLCRGCHIDQHKAHLITPERAAWLTLLSELP